MSLYVATALLAALSFVCVGSDGSIALLALIAFLVGAYSIARNARLEKRSRLCYLAALAFLAILMAVDCYAPLLFDGALTATVVRFVDYAFAPVAVALMLYPLAPRFLFRIAAGVAAFNVALELLSIPFGVVFATDAAGSVVNGPCYWLYAIVNLVAFGSMACALVMRAKELQGRAFAASLGAAVAVLLCAGLHMVFPDSFMVCFALGLGTPLLVSRFQNSLEGQDVNAVLAEVSRESRKRQLAMTALAKRYFSTHLVDFSDGTTTPVSSNESVERIMAECQDGLQKVPHFLEQISAENYQDQIRLFSDFSTIRQRMAERSSISLEFVSKDRGWCSASFVVVDRTDSGEPSSILFTLAVIEEEKRYQAELLSMSVIDPLTGLYNQRAYLEDVAAYGESGMGEDFVIMSLDVNGLKAVNDTLGHSVGDQLLIGAGSCIRQAFARAGRCYRLGGDEFAAILCTNAEDFYNMLEAFEALVAEWKHEQISAMSISSGYAFHVDSPELTIQELGNQADLLMYAAKRRYYENSSADRRLL